MALRGLVRQVGLVPVRSGASWCGWVRPGRRVWARSGELRFDAVGQARHDKALLGMVRLCPIRQVRLCAFRRCWMRPGRIRQVSSGIVGHGRACRGKTWQARHVPFRRGRVAHDAVRFGRQDMARLGSPWSSPVGQAGRCLAEFAEVRQVWFGLSRLLRERLGRLGESGLGRFDPTRCGGRVPSW